MGRAAWARGEAEAARGDIAAGRRWLERARRLVPADGNLAFALGLMRLRDDDPANAAPLFQRLAENNGGRECWAALAHCALALNDHVRARMALGKILSGYALDSGTESLAARLVAEGAIPSWCGLRADGSFAGDMSGAIALIDGRKSHLRGPLWQQGRVLDVLRNGAKIFGSPIDLHAIGRIQGFVQAQGTSFLGWAWHPAAPDTDPVLSVQNTQGDVLAEITARDLSAPVTGAAPLARPRAFTIAGMPAGLLRVLGPDGRDLLGSPLSLHLPPVPKPRRRRPKLTHVPGAVCIVIPVHGGLATTLACIGSVLAAKRPADRILVVNDAAPDPALVAALADLAGITVIPACTADPARNIGFPGAANAGMRAAAGLDVLLLNSDTLVFPGWVQGLQNAAYSAPDIGSATPLSNDASIFSYPDPSRPNPMPPTHEGAAIAALAAMANAGMTVDVPTAHGFCMFIRADCLAATGPFREDVFAQGYGEENDFTERAGVAGYRHVAVPSVYVAHVGSVSFGAGKCDLLNRNLALLDRLHPTYATRIAAFMAADPLQAARARLDAARLHAAPVGKGAVLLVTHGRGGGTEKIVRERTAALREAGFRPIKLVGQDQATSIETTESVFPNLSFVLPADMAGLVSVLAPLQPVSMELHQLLGHDHSVTALAQHFAMPSDIWLHDYAWLCPRVSFVTGEGHFCGEAPPASCDVCVAQSSRVILDPIPAAALRRRSAHDMTTARHVIMSDEEPAARLRRHFPGITPMIRPWEDDTGLPARAAPMRADTLVVVIVGAIGLAKGFVTLLACARDAAARSLPLQFVVVGYTIDDEALLATGHAFVTGEFAPGESTALIRAQGAHIGFLPSVWPETWCYTLSDMWQAGLDVALFDIGVPAARLRRTGRGWALPLGLPPARVNEALLNLQPLAGNSVSQHSGNSAGGMAKPQESPKISGAR